MENLEMGSKVLLIMTAALIGCGGPAPAPFVPASTPAKLTGTWDTALPSAFQSLAVRDGGACYFDALNGASIPSGPIRAKSGAEISMAGWIVADLKMGVVGESAGVQLLASNSYHAVAERYKRPGLGAALKNPAFDDGGLRLLTTPLNPPAGNYRVLFLVRSGGDLLRCDTGREMIIE